MTLVFDTSAFSKILSEDDEAIRVAGRREFTDYVLPLAADAELRFGFKLGNREQANLNGYVPIKQTYPVRIVAPDQETSCIYAELAASCRKRGVSINQNDLWIAATCVQIGGRLLTFDKDFSRVPQVNLVALG